MIIAQKNYTLLKISTNCNLLNAIFQKQLKFSRDAITKLANGIYEKQFKKNNLPMYTIVNLTLEKCN